MLVVHKELKYDLEFLTKKKPLVIYKLVEKAKTKGEKFASANLDVIISAPAPADVTTGPALVTLTQEVQELKA